MTGESLKTERLLNIVLERLKKSEIPDSDEIAEMIRRAKISNHWGVDDQIQIGPHDTQGQFNALLFHEAGHGILPAGCSLTDEERCHQFSKDTCNKLRLPFSPKIVESCREFARVATSQLPEEEFNRRLESIPKRHARILAINWR